MQSLTQNASALAAHMNPLDWCIALVLVLSTVAAFMRGLIRSLLSLVGVIAGVLLALWYCPVLAKKIAPWIGTPALAEIVAFAAILVAVIVAAALLGRLLKSACSAVGMGFMDRLGGACFGFARGVLLLASLLLPMAPYLQNFQAAQTSLLLPYLLPAAHGISFVVPRDFGRRLPATDWWNHAKDAAGAWKPSSVRTMPADVR